MTINNNNLTISGKKWRRANMHPPEGQSGKTRFSILPAERQRNYRELGFTGNHKFLVDIRKSAASLQGTLVAGIYIVYERSTVS